MYRYKLTVKHDAGTINIFTSATSAAKARDLVMAAERCPRRSILSTKNVGRIL
jgi:hypothetical protein